MSPRFSIIIPTHNRPQMLRRAVDSIFQQSCRDWELVVIDDNSTVPCTGMAFLHSDTRVRIHTNRRSEGPGASRRKGVELSSGQYLCFLDDDDYYRPNHLASIEGAIANHSGDDGLFVVQMTRLQPDGSLAVERPFLRGSNPLKAYWKNPVSLLPFVIPHRAAHRWPSPTIPSPIEDFEWVCTLLCHLPCILISVSSVVYVEHDHNRTGNLTRRTDLLAREAVVMRLGAIPNLIPEVGKRAYYQKLTHQRHHWSRQCIRKGQWRDAVWGLLRSLKDGRATSPREWRYTLAVAFRTLLSVD